ncbi:hypothetical protein [Actinoallomurus rhizosphaericola]|uniref:hypothetical protein n=1 Tax=Actinoallomurus rhizosphaericola TaxID=2952536 RepID=UPI0020902D38|nr:hypothetical protein [Actinoallomurus rhizosphaericola]MCO5992545.1 hypothetical protein [Actinoallomurus rhizosphaericola]
MSDSANALVEEATRRSGLIWLTLPDLPQPRAAWHLWHDGAAYVVTGGIEQPLPGLPEAERVTVTVRSKDKGGRVVSWVAAVSEAKPYSEEWEAVVPLLAKERLNAPDGEAQTERWANEAYVMRLTPTGEVTEAPGEMPADYAAVRPVPSPATSVGRPPFMVGGRRRPSDR